MSIDIEAKQLRDAFISGAAYLNAEKDLINELNVFPVPDGDTGTNMTMTIMSAAEELRKMESYDIISVSKAMSSGSLRGARGNSGVILSQLIRGFSKEVIEADRLDAIILSSAFNRAVETAYKAVMKPKEGTILTVAKSLADSMMEECVKEESLVEIFDSVVKKGEESLANTPNLLPVLKEAGVVDSGGEGLMSFMRGVLAYINGEEPDFSMFEKKDASRNTTAVNRGEISTADIKFGYCTEFMINGDHDFSDKELHDMKSYLDTMGDSIVCFSDDALIKVHVHTNHPGAVFEKALTMGSLSKMKIDNMRIEHNEVLIKDASKIAAMEELENIKKSEEAGLDIKNRKKYAFVSVSAGEGLTEIFKGIGVDSVIEGGQTMNPSTEDILNCCEKINAEHIFILPNNKNIILAANQVKDLIEDRDVHVIPSKTIPQGISAMISFGPECSVDENIAIMTDAISTVKSAEITYAVRNTSIDGHAISEGDIISIADKGLLLVEKDVNKAAALTVKELSDDDSEIISIYYGADCSKEDAESLRDELEKKYPLMEVELNYGGQPVYYYFISVE